jgi:cytochrome c-type biogenesis protein CcmH
LLAVVVIGALAFGVRDRDPQTDEERAQSVAETVACPACAGQSVANSDAPAAANLRADISRRIADGQSADEIRAAYAARFGEDILLNPPRSGTAALVWVIPVVAVVAAGSGLALAFRRWRREW